MHDFAIIFLSGYCYCLNLDFVGFYGWMTCGFKHWVIEDLVTLARFQNWWFFNKFPGTQVALKEIKKPLKIWIWIFKSIALIYSQSDDWMIVGIAFSQETERITNEFRKNFERIPKEFWKNSQRIPKEFRKNS